MDDIFTMKKGAGTGKESTPFIGKNMDSTVNKKLRSSLTKSSTSAVEPTVTRNSVMKGRCRYGNEIPPEMNAAIDDVASINKSISNHTNDRSMNRSRPVSLETSMLTPLVKRNLPGENFEPDTIETGSGHSYSYHSLSTRIRQTLLAMMGKTSCHSDEKQNHSPSTCSRKPKVSTHEGQLGKQQVMLIPKAVRIARCLFVAIGLCLVAVGLGFLSFRVLFESEEQRAEDRFKSIAERAFSMAQLVIEEKKLATDSLANVAASAHPRAASWPNVYVRGFEELVATSLRGQGASFCPIVQPGGPEQVAFEEFAYNMFYKVHGMPNSTGVSDFGRGIFNFGIEPFTNMTYPDGRYHAASNLAGFYKSPRDILVPFLQNDIAHQSVLMLNLHSEHMRGKLIDQILSCGEERALIKGNQRECGALTDLIAWSNVKPNASENHDNNHGRHHHHAGDVDPGPAGLMFVPIYPNFDNTSQIKGFIVVKTIFHDLLRHGFQSDVSNIYAVLRTDSGASFTYKIDKGIPTFVGKGDLHPKQAKFSATSHINPNYFGDFSVKYHLDLHSTHEYENDFSSKNPLIACIAAVAIIVFTSVLFFGYDFFVRREFDSQTNLLQAKRQFVRFVSHEVRTPLNTVCMGLSLLQHDLDGVLKGIESMQVEVEQQRYDACATSETPKRIESEGIQITSTNESSTMHTAVDDVTEFSGIGRSSNVGGKIILTKDQVDEWMELTRQLYQNAETAVAVLNDLLNYDKIQMGALTLEHSLFFLWDVLEDVVNEFQLVAVERKINLELDLTPIGILTRRRPPVVSHQQHFKPISGVRDGAMHEESAVGDQWSDRSDSSDDSWAHCKIVADNIRIAQVLRNLISNGLKFTRENGHLKVQVSARKGNGSKNKDRHAVLEDVTLYNGRCLSLVRRGDVIVDLIDDGVGMSKDQVRKVFKEGSQFDSNKFQAGGGSGLGLHIAKGIVIQHGGSLSCLSQGINQGTTFTLSLPLYEESPETVPPNICETVITKRRKSNLPDSENVGAADESVDVPNLHILVVDDSAMNRKLCIRLLTTQGHACEEACDGKEGMRMVADAMEKGQPYDCILLDYEMPNMNGPEACKCIRELLGCESFIVGVTGNLMSEDVSHFRACGADWVLPKPFHLEALQRQFIVAGITPHATESTTAQFAQSIGGTSTDILSASSRIQRETKNTRENNLSRDSYH